MAINVTKWSRGGLALIAIGIGFVLVAACCGCAASSKAGPSKARYADLLHECREANRERARLIKEYERANCATNPEQNFGAVNFGEAGH